MFVVSLLWEREIKRTLRGPLFEREWERVASEFSHDRGFIQYINTLTNRKRLDLGR